MTYQSHIKASYLKSLVQADTPCEEKIQNIERLLGLPVSDSVEVGVTGDENSKSEVMFTKTINGQQTTNSKECNDFSESTSTLTINPDAALSEDVLTAAINYEVSSYRYI